MTREAALHTLLRALFNSQELRLHLALEREGDDLVSALPEGVARSALIAEAIEALKRRGLIDRDFFDRLEDVRPHRRNEIREVRALWLHNARLDRGALWAENRYELIAQCGSGGFGLVWKAIDTQTKIYVALKILHEMYNDNRGIRQRFFRGAAVLAELDHPAIVRVRSSVEQEGLRFFYVMDYIDGESLDALVGKRPRGMLIEYILQVGDALACIHARDLLHRDIKPSNILVNKRGQAKLIDFDLVTGETFAPLTTRALGTAIYAPPEAATSDQKTAAYDVYGLARTVEFILRGRDPTVAELTDVDSVAGLDASEAVKDVLRAALCADPARRTSSVEHFCTELRAGFVPRQPSEPPMLESKPHAESDPPVVDHAVADEASVFDCAPKSTESTARNSDESGTARSPALSDARVLGRRPFTWLAGGLSGTALAGVVWCIAPGQQEQTGEVIGIAPPVSEHVHTQASPTPHDLEPQIGKPVADPPIKPLVSEPLAENSISESCSELPMAHTEVAPMCVVTLPTGESTMGSLNKASLYESETKNKRPNRPSSVPKTVNPLMSAEEEGIRAKLQEEAGMKELESMREFANLAHGSVKEIVRRHADHCDAEYVEVSVVFDTMTGKPKKISFASSLEHTTFGALVRADITKLQLPVLNKGDWEIPVGVRLKFLETFDTTGE